MAIKRKEDVIKELEKRIQDLFVQIGNLKELKRQGHRQIDNSKWTIRQTINAQYQSMKKMNNTIKMLKEEIREEQKEKRNFAEKFKKQTIPFRKSGGRWSE